jgi:hypothetical protein
MVSLDDGIDVSRIVHVEQRARAVDTDTNLHLRYERVLIEDIAPGEIGTLIKTWDYDIDLLSGMLFGVKNVANGEEAIDIGDECCVYANAGVIGIAVTACASGDNEVYVSPTVIENLDPGDFVHFSGHEDCEHHVIAKDADTYKLTFKNAVTHAHASGDYIEMHRYFVGRSDEWMRVAPWTRGREWGSDVLDSSRIPAGKQLVVQYKNTSDSVTKVLSGQAAIYY